MAVRPAASLLVAAVVLVSACGRSPASAVLSDSGQDSGLDTSALADGHERQDGTSYPETRATDAARHDGIARDAGCERSCTDLCQRVISCALYPGTKEKCEAECAGAWGMPRRGCLSDLLCSGNESCSETAACVASPPKPDLTVTHLVASVKGNTTVYTFDVCNQGSGDSDPFDVVLYYQRSTAPPPKQPGDQLHVHPGLPAGSCSSMQLQRSNTPPGTYASWVQVDAAQVIAESDEGNNVAGPAQATVAPPPMPDLIIQQLDGKVNGLDIDFTVVVCNVGQVPSFVFRVDLYYNRLTAPAPWQIGDSSIVLLGLPAGACQTVSRTYKNAPVSIYSAWAQADTFNTVQESNEKNNTAGPKVILMSSSPQCAGLCAFATGCGIFQVSEIQQCLTWCNQMPAASRQCALDATQKGSCADLKACSLPPLPPPLPPPWACLSLCDYLSSPCNYLPKTGIAACVGACISLPITKLQCAVEAMNQQKCLQMFLCIF
jgi:hypothetical protein